MSRRSRKSGAVTEKRSGVPQAPKPATQLAAAAGRQRNWKWWAARLGLAVSVPVLLLVGLEGALRVAGFGYPTCFCLKSRDGTAYIENSRFLWQFYSRKTNLRPNPFMLPVVKPIGSVRIVVIGESAAAGTPDPGYGFARILERMLRQQFPQTRIDVINAAMSGVNSHILLPVARDCLRLKPDLFVVYMGNNEAVGLYAPGSHSARLTRHLGALRFVQWIRAQRLGQLFEPILARITPEAAANAEGQDESFFRAHRLAADDLRRAAVYHNFEANLSDLCRTARSAGAGVLLATVPVNLRDCPPFGSLHPEGLNEAGLAQWQRLYAAGTQLEAGREFSRAITNYLAAAQIDDHFAELDYRLAACRERLGQTNPAAETYQLARDWDAMQFRTDSRLTGITRQVAAAYAGSSVRLVDAQKALREADPIPGERFFRDHVHLNFDGDYLLARTLFPGVCEMLQTKLGAGAAPTKQLPTREEMAAALALTPVNEVQMEAQIVRTTALPPFTDQFDHAPRQKAAEQRMAEHASALGWQDFDQASTVYRAAIAQAPEDWRLHFQFARLLMLRPDLPGAIEQFQAARQLLPHWGPLRLELAAALSRAGRMQEAAAELEAAREWEPQSREIEEALGALSGQPQTR